MCAERRMPAASNQLSPAVKPDEPGFFSLGRVNVVSSFFCVHFSFFFLSFFLGRFEEARRPPIKSTTNHRAGTLSEEGAISYDGSSRVKAFTRAYVKRPLVPDAQGAEGHVDQVLAYKLISCLHTRNLGYTAKLERVHLLLLLLLSPDRINYCSIKIPHSQREAFTLGVHIGIHIRVLAFALAFPSSPGRLRYAHTCVWIHRASTLRNHPSLAVDYTHPQIWGRNKRVSIV